VTLLLWTSRVWTNREKLVATLALPGGPLVAAFAVDAVNNSTWDLAVKVPALALAVALLFARRAPQCTLPCALAADDASQYRVPSSQVPLGHRHLHSPSEHS
jgi:hypothetical protein